MFMINDGAPTTIRVCPGHGSRRLLSEVDCHLLGFVVSSQCCKSKAAAAGLAADGTTRATIPPTAMENDDIGDDELISLSRAAKLFSTEN
jgi:hypothetical protein